MNGGARETGLSREERIEKLKSRRKLGGNLYE
jgi:hypothetical protein